MIPLDLGGLRLEARLPGPPEPVPGGLILPPGPVDLRHPFGATRYYRHGWHSWSPTRWVDLAVPPEPMLPPERRPQADDPVHALNPRHGGSGVGALEGEGSVLLLGALGPGGRVEADPEWLSGRSEGAGTGWFLSWARENEAFGRYSEHLVQRLGARPRDPGPVWCSWYGFYRDLDEGRLRGVLDDLGDLPFRVFQVDDGWQAGLGDWEAGPAFPSGMADLARRIQATGRRAGLWLAPLLVGPESRLFREKPEWLLRDGQGEPVKAGHNWGHFTYALDTTLPEVGDWLEALVGRVLSWGYAYLKLDFLYAGALPGRRFRDVPREEAFREALERIRRAAGDAYVLACGAPIIPSLGLVDGLRIGPDVAPRWDDLDGVRHFRDLSRPATRNAVRTCLHRLWLRPLVALDPDVAYFRTRYNLLRDDHRGLLRDLGWICGFRGTSDPPGWLLPEEREALLDFLERESTVEQVGRYTFRLDGREVDFGAAVDVPV